MVSSSLLSISWTIIMLTSYSLNWSLNTIIRFIVTKRRCFRLRGTHLFSVQMDFNIGQSWPLWKFLLSFTFWEWRSNSENDLQMRWRIHGGGACGGVCLYKVKSECFRLWGELIDKDRWVNLHSQPKVQLNWWIWEAWNDWAHMMWNINWRNETNVHILRIVANVFSQIIERERNHQVLKSKMFFGNHP